MSIVKIGIVNDDLLKVINVVKYEEADVPQDTEELKYVPAEYWMSPNVEYGWSDATKTVRVMPHPYYGVVDDNGIVGIDPVKKAEYDAEQLARELETLYSNYIEYQNKVIDSNLNDEMNKSESAVENGTLTVEQLPFAQENGDWLEAYWNVYYSEKAKCEAGEEYNSDPSVNGIPPRTFSELRTERKTALGG